jgi:hypothetical protein
LESYTIYLYDSETNKYTELGSASGADAKDAAKTWKREAGWKSEKNSHLIFAKPPLCR